jgi:hypothetical protein
MKWQALFGIIISFGVGLFIVSRVNFDQLATALQSADYVFLVLTALVQVSTHLVRAWRWQYLLEPVKPIRMLPLLSATSIGFLANMLLPAHAGEIVRAYVISRREEVSTMASLGTIVVERVADLVSILVVLLLVLMSLRLPQEMAAVAEGLKIGGYIFAGAGLVFIGSLWLLQFKTAQAVRLLGYCLTVLPHHWRERLLSALTAFALGLQALRKGRHVLAVFGLSLFMWLIIAFCNLLIFYAFDLDLPPVAALFLLVVQIVSATVPSGPGFIGTYHAAVVAGLAVFEVTQELALSVAILMHASFFFPFVLVGFLFLWGESLSLRDLSMAKARNPER